MDLNCSRCHQPVQDGYCYCPACGLPQLVYSAENSGDEGQSTRWDRAVRDASAVDWKSALRSILPLAIPAGILCSTLSPVGILGLLMVGGAAAWAVALYMRRQRPAWITVGAGARIGLVCGLLAGALAFAMSGCELYTQRYILHQGSQIDADWKKFVDLDMQFSHQFGGWIGTPQSSQIQAQETQEQKWMLSPEGHAGIVIADFAFGSFLLVIFAMAGGALGARRLARPRQS
jgi:hypothetical protein